MVNRYEFDVFVENERNQDSRSNNTDFTPFSSLSTSFLSLSLGFILKLNISNHAPIANTSEHPKYIKKANSVVTKACKQMNPKQKNDWEKKNTLNGSVLLSN